MDDLLEVRNLKVEYHTDNAVVHAVNDLTLTIKKGQTLGIVGETGAGKTTIAKSIMRVLPEMQARVKSGEIILQGEDLMKLSEKNMRKIRGNKIAMIFQDPMTALNPIERVGSQIAETIKQHNKKLSRLEIKDRAVAMLETVGIPGDRLNEYPHQFSGGMKQRVVIALALACNPELLLADEPTTALDVTIQAQVLDVMRDLKSKFSTSFILITHDLGIVADFCDSVAVVYAGEVVETGSLEDIYRKPAHPYTVGLFASLPTLDSTEKRLKPIMGLMPDPTEIPRGCRFYERCPEKTDKCANAPPKSHEISPGHFVMCFQRMGEV